MNKLIAVAILSFAAVNTVQANAVVVPLLPVVGTLPVLGPVVGPVLTNVVTVVGGLPVVGQGGVSLPDVPVLGPTLLTPVLSAVGSAVGSLPGGGNQGGVVIPTLPGLPALPGLPQ